MAWTRIELTGDEQRIVNQGTIEPSESQSS